MTESSAVSATALNGVTTGLEEHAKSVEGLVTNLSNHVSSTSATAIADLTKRSEETLLKVSANVQAIETSQSDAIETLSSSSKNTLTSVIDEVKKVEAAQIAVANAVKELQETLKNTVSL